MDLLVGVEVFVILQVRKQQPHVAILLEESFFSYPISCTYGTVYLHIFTYIWLKFRVHVGQYTSPMEPLG